MNLKQDANSLPKIIKRKMAFFGHACRNNRCDLVKTCIHGMTKASLEENIRLTEDRTAWRERSCAAGGGG